MKDRNYWLERGKNGPKKTGYICVGGGNELDYLTNQLGIGSENLYADSCGISNEWDGSDKT